MMRRRDAPPPQPVYLRHDLALRNWDVVVSFDDGTAEVLKVQARDPMSAMRLAAMTPSREWPADKLLSVVRMRARRA